MSTRADTIEKEIRDAYLPAQLAGYMNQILDIDMNIAWVKTPAGKAEKKRDQMTPEDVAKIVKKQIEHRAHLQEKVDFIKAAINKRR